MADQSLNLDYMKHPAFPQPLKTFSLDEDVEIVFEHLYSRFSNPCDRIGGTPTPLVDMLAALFEQWRSECAEELEVLFVDTLQLMCRNVLDEQADYFRQGKSRFAQNSTNPNGVSDSNERFVIGQLSPEQADVLEQLASSEVKVFRQRANAGALKRSDLSTGRGRTVRKLVRQLNRFFQSNGILEWVSNCSGTEMAVGGLALELSDARSDWWRHKIPEVDPPRTMYAHVDEAIGIPKAIVYLSEVDFAHGPTSCYPELYEDLQLNALSDVFGRAVSKLNEPGLALSKALDDGEYHQAQSSRRFRELFMKLPPSLRFYSHLGWDVIPGSSLEKEMVDRETFILGPSGTFIVFDGGRLFHRGGLIEEGERIALQVLFKPRAQTRISSRARRRLRKHLKDWTGFGG